MSVQPPPGAPAAALLAGALAAAGLGACSPSARPARRAGPAVSHAIAADRVGVSPQSGTPDASPSTQISFLGAPAASLGAVVVVGSRSGRHPGRLEDYSGGQGASFLPSRPFLRGERVQVRVGARPGGLSRPLRLRFTIARPARISHPPHPGKGRAAQVARGHLLRETFHSRPSLHPPLVTVTTAPGAPATGDIFVAPLTTVGTGGKRLPQRGPMILDPQGRIVWFHALHGQTAAENFSVQRYRGAPALTWWQGRINPLGFGQGEDVVLDSSYREVARVRGGNGYQPDLHDFVLTSRGSAWFTCYVPVRADLRAIGGRRDGAVLDAVVQEVDVKTGLVMFEWHSVGHINLRESRSRIPKHAYDFDYAHVNSIQVVRGSRLVLSARNTWTIYEVSTRTGKILWRLGGRRSTFHLARGAQFAWQHDAHLHSDGTVSVFDNEAAPPIADQSRALQLRLDRAHRTATVAHQYTHPQRLIAGTQGSVQDLPGGRTFVGWGSDPYFSEFSARGRLVLDGHFTRPIQSYRAYRFAWNGRPTKRPALAAARARGGGLTVYASWNGATGVARWQVLVGPDAAHLHPAGHAVANQGFETHIRLNSALPYLAVQALGPSGRPLATSDGVRV